MRAFLRVIMFVVLLVVVLAGGAVAYWLTADASVWKEKIATLASAQLGRTLSIAGGIKPTFSLTQGFGLEITGVSLSNAEGFSPKEMLSIDRVALVVDIMAALQKQIHIKSFALEKADVTLEQKGGRNNWTFPLATAQADKKNNQEPSANAVPPIAADSVAIDNLRLTTIMDGVHKDYSIKTMLLTAAADAPVTLKLTAQAEGKDVAVDLTAGTLHAITTGQKQKIVLALTYGLHNVLLKADYRRTGKAHQFSAMNLDYNGMTVTGSAGVDLAGTVPFVTANIAVPIFDLAMLPKDQAGGAGAAQTAAPAQALFSRELLPWTVLKTANLDAAVDVKQLRQGQKDYGPANIQAKLKNGALDATINAQPPGATLPITMAVQANAAQTVTLSLSAPGLDAATLAHWLGQEEPLVRAPAKFDFNLTGRGASLHEVMGGANGQLLLDFAPGKLNINALPLTVTSVLASLIGQDKLDNATIGCLKADFAIQNGMATPRGLGLAASVLNGSGDGIINLKDETIAMRMVLDARDTLKAAPLLPVTIRGGLVAPVITADTSALAGQVADNLLGDKAEKFGLAGMVAKGVLTGGNKTQVDKPFNPCRPNDKPEEKPVADVAPAKTITPQDLLKDPNAAKELMKNPAQLLNMFGR